jgi:tetratricopeptide (TPR) repeat protein
MIVAQQTWAIALAILCAGPPAAGDEPNDARASYQRGLGRASHRDLDGALADDSQAVSLDPQFVDAWFTRTSLYAKRRQDARAVDDLTRVLAIKPGDYPARFNCALYRESLGEYDIAIGDYSSVLDTEADLSRSGSSRNLDLAHAYHHRRRAYHGVPAR